MTGSYDPQLNLLYWGVQDPDGTHADIDDAGAHRAAIVGHDWGAMVAWNFALLHPDRVVGVVGMSVPPVPTSSPSSS